MTKRIRDGLARQKVLDTKISGIENSIPHIRGYSLSDLVKNSTFEETTYLLLHEELPNKQEYSLFLDKFRAMREDIPEILHKQMEVFKGGEYYTNVLVNCFSALASEIGTELYPTKEKLIDYAMKTIVITPTLLAWHVRKRKGEKAIMPKKDLDHSNNFYYMCYGKVDRRISSIIDKIIIGSCENELSVSTFSARVTASARPQFFDAVVSGLSAFKGYRHGTAMDQVRKELEFLSSNGQDIDKFYRDKAEHNELRFGFGHRVHKNKPDERVLTLKKGAEKAYKILGGRLFPVAKKIEEYLAEKGEGANADFYLPPLLDSLHLNDFEVSAVVLLGRIAGMSAHIVEDMSGGKSRPLFRPRAEYNGALNRKYVPMKNRQKENRFSITHNLLNLCSLVRL